MHRSFLYIPFAAALLVLLVLQGCAAPLSGKPYQHAVQGEMDLRDADLEREPVKLQGEWRFYPYRLLESQSLSLDELYQHVEVPGSWNSYLETNSSFKSGLGYGTYVLRFQTHPGDYILSLRVPNISSSYKLWIDGKPMAFGGVVGTDKASSEPDQLRDIVPFYNGDGEHELIVEVSNFFHRRGGIWTDFYLGGVDAVNDIQTIEAAEQMGLFGSLFMIGFYHIGLFVLRRQERFTLYFGLLCLLIALRIVVVGDVFIMQWLPVSWETSHKIEYISFSLSPLFGYLYVYFLFPADASKRIVRLLAVGSSLLFLFVLLAPVETFSRQLWLFQSFVIMTGLFALIALVLSVKRRRAGSLIVLTGMFVFILSVINDVSFYNEWFGISDMIPAGLFFFIMMQAFIISNRFSHALHKVEEVSDELKSLNLQLEERIAERTQELLQTNEALEKSYEELERQEGSRRRLLTNISHDLRTPMTLIQGYLEAMQDGVIKDRQEQEHYVRIMLDKLNGLNRLISDLFELSKLEAGQVSFHHNLVRLDDWVEQLRGYYMVDIEGRDIRFRCELLDTSTQPSAVWLWIDEFRMKQTLSNLVYNALTHMSPDDELALTFRYDQQQATVEVKVADTGSGIPQEDLPHIFERFYKNDKSRNSAQGSGSGIGLAIVKEIIDAHRGSIAAESILGAGSVFTITLPAEVKEVLK
ncbi:sensor histidine kinase [Paenibacillus sp. GCM10012307]|uniref:histidine kinase n=1 Tax=Paenibacillus roseus TaxID=2798579 RepID=A0A934MQW9_9BACL|nr:sensor histidine kinase [Paenibacillus roseus]MBJ6363611.1 hypothetical protein [Paenibacillus roseus]